MPNAIPLILDNGLYTSLAERMGRDGAVAYFSSWLNAFPQSREVAPGSGLKNVERVDDPLTFMLEGRASHIIVPDLYLDGYQALARAMELPCFGAGDGARLETDRWFLKEFLAEHGLPVIHSQQVEGLDALRDLLQKEDDRYIKVSVFRGDLETYHHVDWRRTEPQFNRWKVQFGAMGNKVRFIVEDPIPDARELGIDTFFRGGKWLEPFFFGPEIKDGGYAGKLSTMADMEKGVRQVMAALAAYFGQTGYDWFFSNEMRIRQSEVFMTDATCRIPSPPGGAMLASMRNFTKFLLEGDAPDWDGEWICEIILKSDTVKDSWMEVEIPPSMRGRMMLHNHCQIDGQTWIAPHDSKYVEFGSACGWGGSLDDAKAMALETAKAIAADGLYFDDHVLDKAEEAF